VEHCALPKNKFLPPAGTETNRQGQARPGEGHGWRTRAVEFFNLVLELKLTPEEKHNLVEFMRQL
jgi:hypothetical protein